MAKDLNLDKLPPQNLDAEMAVLGSMLLDEEAVSISAEKLDAACFYKDSHRKIFQAISDLYNANKAVDLITLTDALKKDGSLEEIGGVSYLTSLANAVPTAANINHYAGIVREKYILRSLINNSTKIITVCHESEGNIAEVVDTAEKLIFEVSDRRNQGTYLHLKEIVKDSIETIDKLYQNKAHVTGIPTGYIDFDLKTAGLQPSDLIIIAGRPSMGKSAFALGIAEYAGVIEKV
ncbi:MAG: replicative DNA helicase, partial [Candidatus Omnitrophica bacterium CG11_big_fil_rev_8_21_14_0_20_43_6]